VVYTEVSLDGLPLEYDLGTISLYDFFITTLAHEDREEVITVSLWEYTRFVLFAVTEETVYVAESFGPSDELFEPNWRLVPQDSLVTKQDWADALGVQLPVMSR
jgi:hypothetical protein